MLNEEIACIFERMAGRLLDALANPHVDILAHPTGRLVARLKGS
jgi:histidinol phosphatase-like PHP family hydrolase